MRSDTEQNWNLKGQVGAQFDGNNSQRNLLGFQNKNYRRSETYYGVSHASQSNIRPNYPISMLNSDGGSNTHEILQNSTV